MCGIVGYVGEKQALEVVVGGLRRLEYRGYDSAGVAVVCDDRLETRKSELTEAGVHLSSETDTEVVAHLLAAETPRAHGDLAEAMRRVCRRLEGAFTLVAIDSEQPDLVVGARRNSPLVVGRGDGENFLGSDVSAFIAHTREAIELGQDQVVALTRDSIVVTGFDGSPAVVNEFTVTWDASAAEKGGYDTFMLKEIAEQPRAVADTLRGRIGRDGLMQLDEVRLSDAELREIDKIIIIACGTAYHAGLIAKYAIEHWTRIPCEVELASEFRYRDPILDRQTLVIAISQSGETMDTLMALRHAREQGSRVLAICNTQGSTIPRESDGVLYTRAGPEVAVASTKAFLTQVVACYLVALYLAQVRGNKFGDEITSVLRELADMPQKIDLVLDTVDPVRALARSFEASTSVLFIGRHVGYPVALEGALKLKELAYMHAEGFAAGELKHGPIALLEDGLPVIVVVPSPRGRSVLHEKIVSNIQEVRARGALTIVIAEEGDEAVTPYADHIIRVPQCPTLLQPLLATVPLQVFACEMATARGHDVDQPRNLAKSVTVE